MQSAKDLCRLCFTANTPFKIIGDYLNEIFEVLLLNVNLAVSENPVICRNCEELVWRAFSFKSTCISTEEIILSHAVAKDVTSLDMKWIYHMEMACEVTENSNVCRFCMGYLEEGNYLYLEDIKCLSENKLRRFLPEIEFNTIEPVVCMNCIELLKNYFKFALTCASIEEKINKYCQQEGTNSNGFVNFRDVVKFSFREGLRLIATGNETFIKKESLSNDDDSDDDDYGGGDFKEFDIKIEEYDLKEEMIVDLLSEPEYSLEDFKHHDKLENGKVTQKICPDLQYKCPFCEFKSQTKAGLRKHVGIHIVEPNGETFRNAICEDQRDNSSHLNRVVPVHKDVETDKCLEVFNCGIREFETKHSDFNDVHLHKTTSEVTTYKCSKCEYKTNCKEYLTKHSLVHKDSSMYKCSKCEFKTKRQSTLKRHSIVHKDASELTIRKRQGALKRHSLVHKDSSEVTMYRCGKCEYRTKYQEHLKRHSVVHTDTSELAMYKCSKCQFKTKYQKYLKDHSLVHKDTSELTMYTCCECKFKSKYQNCPKRHSLVHKDSSEVTMPKRKGSLKKHSLLHKDTSKLTMYKCCKCEYQTICQMRLKQHSLVHKDSSEVTMYKCSKCEFKTKRKGSLKTHSLVHMEASELTMYKCIKCGFKTKHKGAFKTHSLVHMEASELTICVETVNLRGFVLGLEPVVRNKLFGLTIVYFERKDGSTGQDLKYDTFFCTGSILTYITIG
ncbi:hypothetical protein NQ317_015797 [Molorchus minor]|uniref:C2H2-type domain-containing protein n=1 Tax=Molorchus minor TaxID=1323400 RepID=A0ABQ9J252_9CUCU|nr:hypothetical protein NQ317_015797 [Molorchus minor]